MKKKLFTLQVLTLALAFPLYFFAEVNHGAAKDAGKNETNINAVQACNKAKAKLYVILKMPAAPEYQVQLINE